MLKKIYYFIFCSGFVFDKILKINHILKRVLFIRYSPLKLLDKKLSSKDFSVVLSDLNIGGFFKTVGYLRHNIGDQIISKYLEKSLEKVDFCDIGVSDGSGSLRLYDKFTEKYNSYDLYDKFKGLYYKKNKFYTMFYNINAEAIYLQIGVLLLFIYSFKIKIKDFKGLDYIDFTNPEIIKRNLNIKEFDIIEDSLDKKYDIIKIANLLNLSYFDINIINNIIKKIGNNLKENGIIVIIQNNNKYKDNEAVIVLKKIGGKMVLDEYINNHDILKLLKI